jgi:hypothetical protein
MLLLQEGPANTTNYMIIGYVVIFGAILLYLISLAIRQRNLRQDLAALQETAGVDEA